MRRRLDEIAKRHLRRMVPSMDSAKTKQLGPENTLTAQDFDEALRKVSRKITAKKN